MNYCYHFIIKDFDGEFNFLEGNTEKYKTFSVPIEIEVTRVGKNGEEITNTISYRLQFIDSVRFVIAHYQILLIILLKEFIKLNVNTDMMVKNVKPV